jgi:hypothetical protein
MNASEFAIVGDPLPGKLSYSQFGDPHDRFIRFGTPFVFRLNENQSKNPTAEGSPISPIGISCIALSAY